MLVLAGTVGIVITIVRLKTCTSDSIAVQGNQVNSSGESYVTTEPNPAYSYHDNKTSPHTSMQDIKLAQNEACTATPNIPVEPNQCYVTTTPSVDPDQLYATVEEEHQQQDMELIEKKAYAATPNIPMEPNQSYVTTTPSVDPDPPYATMEEPGETQYEYINPY